MNEDTQLTVTNQGGALMTAAADAAALAAMMAEDAGDGLQNVTAADIAIPYFKLLQKGSPECEEGNQTFMADANPGMLLDSVTRALVDIRSKQDKFAVVVPVSYVKVISEWRPNQGGKVMDHPMSQAMLDGATRKETPDGGIILVNEDGNVLEETAKFHVLLIGVDGVAHWGILALSGSKLGAAKKWMNLVTTKKLPNGQPFPMYSHLYKVSSYLETSKRTGKTYQQLRFDDGGRITDPKMYGAAKDYRLAVNAGTVKEDTGHTATDAAPVDPDGVPF